MFEHTKGGTLATGIKKENFILQTLRICQITHPNRCFNSCNRIEISNRGFYSYQQHMLSENCQQSVPTMHHSAQKQCHSLESNHHSSQRMIQQENSQAIDALFEKCKIYTAQKKERKKQKENEKKKKKHEHLP